MVQYATAAELASYMQQDVDTSTANLNLVTASSLFQLRAGTAFTPTTATFQTVGTRSFTLYLPYRPIISIQALRIAGVTIASSEYVLIRRRLYRLLGFGFGWIFPPELVEVDLTYGYATCPDDVKGAVLETAASAYVSPDNVVTMEKIDDYAVQSSAAAGGMQLSPAAEKLALFYRGAIIA